MACREHSGHEVDVIALDRASLPRGKSSNVTLLGEAKYTAKPRGIGDLRRLEHIAGLLAERGYRTSETAYALFSRAGFTDELRRARSGGVHLLDLDALYGGQSG